MRRLEQLVSLQATDGAVVLIGADDALPKRCLVQPLPENPGRVSAADRSLLDVCVDIAKAGEGSLINTDRERELGDVVANDVNRPLWGV